MPDNRNVPIESIVVDSDPYLKFLAVLARLSDDDLDELQYLTNRLADASIDGQELMNPDGEPLDGVSIEVVPLVENLEHVIHDARILLTRINARKEEEESARSRPRFDFPPPSDN